MHSLQSFFVDPDNPSFSSIDGVIFNKTHTQLLRCPEICSESYVVPDSVDTIGANAFNYCKQLHFITIPASVTSIADTAFLYHGELTIRGYAGSYAETYANKYYIPFEDITP